MLKHTLAAAALVALFYLAPPAGAQTVGPGPGITNQSLDDTNGGRVNLDLSTPLVLPAGTYSASLFSFDAGRDGVVIPFLAFQNAPDKFTALAVGAQQTLAGAVQDSTVAFGGSAQFTLTGTTTIYAGIATPSGEFNPVPFRNGSSTNHEGGGGPASVYVISVGGPVPGDDNFDILRLGRIYAFSVTVVPEPATAMLLLGGLGLLSVLLRRRV